MPSMGRGNRDNLLLEEAGEILDEARIASSGLEHHVRTLVWGSMFVP